jgi:hypothetical protein
LISKGPVIIEDECWLGFSCEILSGVHIGRHSIIAAQQGLVYRLSGLTPLVSETFIDKYKNGSKPDELTTQEEVNEIKALLTSTLDQTLVDYEEGKFKNYQEYQTKTGFLLKNLEDALQFNNYHEGIHLGFIMKIKKHI